jgi:hypothetical protein
VREVGGVGTRNRTIVPVNSTDIFRRHAISGQSSPHNARMSTGRGQAQEEGHFDRVCQGNLPISADVDDSTLKPDR